MTPDLHQQIERAARIIGRAKKIAALTGAGISAESGVPTFRGAGGLWEGYRVEDVATPAAFARDPALVWRFYNLRRAGLAAVRPNPGHHALAALEDRLGQGRFTLITQNVDGLHRAAGSRRVLEIHGTLRRVRCTGCAWTADRATEALPDLPRCGACHELLRPDVVWFNELLPPDTWQQAEDAAQTCDCFLVIGTSAVVYPAAGLVESARLNGAEIIEVNLTATRASSQADVTLLGPSGSVLPAIVQRL
ncbi:MAG: NAD-dependent deacylase [Gemmataceae bacterium]|nr:NAD-dependent deacylase [Gemmataceae bacterium]